MEFKEHVSLKTLTTLKVGGEARYFVVVKTIEDVEQALLFAREKQVAWFVLGGGSNVLFPDTSYPGLIIKVELKGIEEIKKTDQVWVRASAGEVWDDLVAYSVERGWYGLENLSFIPGFVGGAPIQNIGAYGVEVGSLIREVTAWDAQEGKVVRLSKTDCAFGYRDSIFKTKLGKRYVVLDVQFELVCSGLPNLSYRDVAEYFKEKNTPTLSEVRSAIGSIRARKFPDLRNYGTAGSFFKNPIVAEAVAEKLLSRYPGLPVFPAGKDKVKLSLAWILDNILHVKGIRHGVVGTFEAQPLVLVTYEGARASDVEDFAEHIEALVRKKIGVEIEQEVVSVKV